MGAKVVNVRLKGALTGLDKMAKEFGEIPKEMDAQFSRAVQIAAFQAIYQEVAPQIAESAPVDSGAYRAGLLGETGAYTAQKRKAARYSYPILDFTPMGNDISVEYGSDPFEETDGGEHPYGQFVKHGLSKYRPMINQAMAGAVQSTVQDFVRQLVERALDRSWVPTRTGRGFKPQEIAKMPRSRQLKIFRQRRYILRKRGAA